MFFTIFFEVCKMNSFLQNALVIFAKLHYTANLWLQLKDGQV